MFTFTLTSAENASNAGMNINAILIIPFLLLLVLGLAVYFIPSLIAFRKKHINKVGILLLNIFLGWTLVGWVAALIWSIYKKTPTYPQYPQYPSNIPNSSDIHNTSVNTDNKPAE